MEIREVLRTIVEVRGEVDAHSAPLLREGFRSIDGTRDVELDLAAVTFMDSSGLHVLAGLVRQLGLQQRRLCVVEASTPVRRLLEISGVAGLLTTSPRPLG